MADLEMTRYMNLPTCIVCGAPMDIKLYKNKLDIERANNGYCSLACEQDATNEELLA